MPSPSASDRLRALAGAGAVALMIVLAGCSGGGSPASTPTPTVAPDPSATASPTPEQPALHPDGTAADNLPLFEQVTAQVWASEQRAQGRAYIDALVAAGFDKAAMQVTEDLSTVGNAAESMQFSVRWGDHECLVGQVGPSTGNPVTMVLDQLAEGRCLIGDTRPIDW